MKRGFFRTEGSRRPFVEAVLTFPLIGSHTINVQFLVDTGADRTALSPSEGMRLRVDYDIDLLSLPRGNPSAGIGGQMQTRLIESTLSIDDFSVNMTLPIFEPPPAMAIPDWMPSLLGRDVIYEFALFMEHSTDRLLLLEPDESAAIDMPS